MQDFQTKMVRSGKAERLFTHLKCKDGFTMSVQGSEHNYSCPRRDVEATQYSEMEIGFPSQEEPLILEYAEQPEIPTGTVYGYVPVDLIQKVIDKHGGLA